MSRFMHSVLLYVSLPPVKVARSRTIRPWKQWSATTFNIIRAGHGRHVNGLVGGGDRRKRR